MAIVTVEAGVCGFSTTIRTSSEDMQTVNIDYDTSCPHIEKAKETLKNVDAYRELFSKPHDTNVYRALSPHLPHVTCPVYSGFLKAIEAAAGMALPRDVTMRIEK